MDKLIRKIRQKANMTQEEFANALGTTVLSINRWENGKTEPNKMAQKELLSFCKKHQLDLSDFIVEEVKQPSSDNELILYHGSKTGIKGDILPTSRPTCDFGEGFYLGNNPLQPLTLICDEERPILYTMKLNLDGLKVLSFKMNLEWALFISFHRGYMNSVKGSDIYHKFESISQGYDVIYGCIADDRMYRVMKNFFDEEITDSALIHSLSALDLGYQYVCKTPKACAHLQVLSQKVLSPLELDILHEKSVQRRDESLLLTEDILRKYRREGRYFDEILRGEKK